MKQASDGGPSDYYDFPEGMVTLNDLIEHKKMSFAQGNIFKAAYRMGNKEGIDLEYDLRKIIYYANRMLDQEKKKKTKNIDWRYGKPRLTLSATPTLIKKQPDLFEED